MKKQLAMLIIVMMILSIVVGFVACGPNTEEYTLTIEVTGDGTIYPVAGTYEHKAGTEVTITATPTTNEVSIVWVEAGKDSDTTATVTMDADKTVKVIFVLDSSVINFPDTNLENAVREAISDPPHTGDITFADVKSITELTANNACSNAKIENLAGIEYLVSLTELDLIANDITDCSYLSGLMNLTELNLGGNDIVNISALGRLTNLTELDLSGNDIANISHLSNLTNLKKLDLEYNHIVKISALDGLTNLTTLNLSKNDIVKISALDGLTNLTTLNLDLNDIFDISALGSLTNLKELNFQQNDIFDISALGSLTNLKKLDLTHNHMEIDFYTPNTNGTVVKNHRDNGCDVDYREGNTVIGTPRRH